MAQQTEKALMKNIRALLSPDLEPSTPTESRHTTCLVGGKSPSVKLMSRRENKDSWYGVILWVLRALSQGLKSECADIFPQSFLCLLRHTNEPQEGRNSCLWLQSRSVSSSFGVVLMSCRVNFDVVRSPLQYSACRI